MKQVIDNVTIVGNNHPIDILYRFEILDGRYGKKWAKEVESDDYTGVEDETYFFYRNWLYRMSDFMSVSNSFHNPNPPEWQKDYDGYLSDSFFSGILIKYVRDDYGIDSEHILAYTFYS